MIKIPSSFWNLGGTDLLNKLESSKTGLTGAEAERRRVLFGANKLSKGKNTGTISLLAAQFKSPIILILFFAIGLSFFLKDTVDAGIILAIVLVSGLLGFFQERGAAHAVEKLLSIVQIRAHVLRDGMSVDIPVELIVPGDIVVLNAGDIVPGDCLILESNDLFVDEAMLTGETFPVEKEVGVLPADTALGKRTNALLMGTHVVSGSATVLVAGTGRSTEFGKVSEHLKLRPLETEFERGIRQFGFFLMEVTLFLVVAIFGINVFLSRPVLDSFLFSLALAVGLTPQLLPAIISINLSHGAKRMAEKKVIIKRPSSIENFGSMNVLCSDKTGTLTLGTVKLNSALDAYGVPSDSVFHHAYLNSFYETGFTNPIDKAILDSRKEDISGYQKVDEIPYDFLRKRLTVVVSKENNRLMVTKGALTNILTVCSSVDTADGKTVDISTESSGIQKQFEILSEKGFRILGVAHKNLEGNSPVRREDEKDMAFSGFLVFFDPPKPGINEAIQKLAGLGVALKVITGDNRLVAAYVSGQIGLSGGKILTGPELNLLSDAALLNTVGSISVFAEIEPNQKERIIIALKKAGNVVGYMGDGINDVSAIHAADVGVSVDSAVDVAKDAADIVLLEKDLAVLADGVLEGRTTFANTIKYVFMATSANFGNMFSMAGISLVLPFLPLLPKQILLTNLMTDFPEMTIATDSVDPEMINYPRRWNIKSIKKFMITFGIVSSVFDFLTFAVLLFVLKAGEIEFRTGWFLESVLSASLIVLVIRSRRSFLKSKPGKYLLGATLSVFAATILFLVSPLAPLFGFTSLRLPYFLLIGVIITLYIFTTEMVKKIFYRLVKI